MHNRVKFVQLQVSYSNPPVRFLEELRKLASIHKVIIHDRDHTIW